MVYIAFVIMANFEMANENLNFPYTLIKYGLQSASCLLSDILYCLLPKDSRTTSGQRQEVGYVGWCQQSS